MLIFRSLRIVSGIATLSAGCAFGQVGGQSAVDISPFFAEVDANHDGCATRDEWERAGAPMSSYESLKDEKGCVTRAHMQATVPPPGVDLNGDGKLTLAEIKAFDNKHARKLAKQASPAPSKAETALELQNLMSRRMFYHSVGRNELELTLWSKRHSDAIRWAQNQGCWIGMKSLKVYYDDVNREMQAAQLKTASKNNPAILDVPQNRNIGNTVLHTLTTPIIEVADDGQSAKGVWYTPGVILTTAADGRTAEGTWMWERYGVDFIREDGHWAILHAQVNTDFAAPFGAPLPSQTAAAATMGSEGGKDGAPAPGPGGGSIKVPPPDIPAKTYEEFGATRVPRLEPRLPQPYRTLKETFEYADCAPSARGQ